MSVTYSRLEPSSSAAVFPSTLRVLKYDLSCASLAPSQLLGNGYLQMSQMSVFNGLTVSSGTTLVTGGLAVNAGGGTVVASYLATDTGLSTHSGSMSVISASAASGAVMDIQVTSGAAVDALNANVVGNSGSLLQLLTGTSSLMLVRPTGCERVVRLECNHVRF